VAIASVWLALWLGPRRMCVAYDSHLPVILDRQPRSLPGGIQGHRQRLPRRKQLQQALAAKWSVLRSQRIAEAGGGRIALVRESEILVHALEEGFLAAPEDISDNEPIPFDLLRPSHHPAEPHIDTGEAARQLGISRQAVAQAIQKRRLAGYGIARARRTGWYALKSAVDQHSQIRASDKRASGERQVKPCSSPGNVMGICRARTETIPYGAGASPRGVSCGYRGIQSSLGSGRRRIFDRSLVHAPLGNVVPRPHSDGNRHDGEHGAPHADGTRFRAIYIERLAS